MSTETTNLKIRLHISGISNTSFSWAYAKNRTPLFRVQTERITFYASQALI